MTNLELTRRGFVVTAAAAGGGMMLGVGGAGAANISGQPWMSPTDKDGTEISQWISIDPEGVVTLAQAKQEMGQGTFTGLPQILIEELQADWSKVRVQYADVNRHIRNDNLYGSMGTYGSGGTRRSRVMLQQAGASARERLKEAAAQAWGVNRAQVAAKDGVLSAGNNSGTYADFATAAASVVLAEEPAIKTPDQFTLIGTSVARLDTPLKVNGAAMYSADTRLPGMLYASVRFAPVPWSTIKSYDAEAIMDRPGVVQVVELSAPADVPDWDQGRDSTRNGVAVVADTWYRAQTALGLMPIEWDDGPRADVSTDSIYQAMYDALEIPGFQAEEPDPNMGGVAWLDAEPTGDALGIIEGSGNVLTADYHRPYQAHARMEVSGATVSVTDDRVDAFVSSQNPPGEAEIIAEVTGRDPADIYVHNNFLGGGFGGNGPAGMGTRPAAEIAAAVGQPVKLLMPREEDLAQNAHRPANVTRFKAVIGDDGLPLANYTRSINPALNHNRAGDRISDHPYFIPNRHHEAMLTDASHITGTHHRAPGSAQNGFMIEQFADEMALAGGWDPLEWRLELTKDRADWQLVLKTLKEVGGFTTDLPRGQGAGIGVVESHGTIAGVVAHADVSRRGQLRVWKVVAAYDSGHNVNPDMCRAQVEGCVAWELGHTLTADLRIGNGRVTTSNFDTYNLARIGVMPQVEVHAALSGGDKWGGMGEPAAPPVAPAIANAIFFATGKRIRSTPIQNHDLSYS